MTNLTSFALSLGLSTRSTIEPIDPSDVPFWVYQQNLNQYFQLATVTVLVYDAIITMDKEAKFFWKIPQNSVDIVYLANRYVGILGAIAFSTCDFAQWTRNISNWVTVISIDYILVIRVLALYSRDKMLSICLKTLLVLEAIFKLALVIYLGQLERFAIGGLARNVTVCGIDNTLPWQWGVVDWVLPLVYGTILMILALYKAAGYWKMSAGFEGFALVKVLIQDQILYFILAIGCSVLNILQFKLRFSNLFWANTLNALGSPSCLCVVGSRMLINLKEAGERGQNEGTSYRITSNEMSEIDFAAPQRFIPPLPSYESPAYLTEGNVKQTECRVLRRHRRLAVSCLGRLVTLVLLSRME
ncbi:hypothetical protein ACEPAH_9213 [Sanghuangporus vaninii]